MYAAPAWPGTLDKRPWAQVLACFYQALIRTDSSSAHRNTALIHSLLSIFYPFALSQHARKAHPRPGPPSKPMQPLFGQCIDPMTLFPHHVDQFLAFRQVSRVIPPPRPPHLFVSLRAPTSITDWS